jgi:4-carboxymuconolactone decarboxylase
MDDQQRHAQGLERRRAVLGDAHVDRAIEQTTPLSREFQDLITRYAWGEIWTRPGLDVRSRRILVIGTMIAIGRWEEFQMHAAAAMREGGVSLDDLKEIVLQQAIYCGVPAAHHALKLLAELETS